MKQIVRIILLILSITLILSVFASCGDDSGSSAGDATEVKENKADEPIPVDGFKAAEKNISNERYLSFCIKEGDDERVIAKMHVKEGDTYESLEPFFPTIPEKEGYMGYWSPVEVYQEEVKDVKIFAAYKSK